MVLCGLCKKEVSGEVEWVLRDITMSSPVADNVMICGDCASKLVKSVLSDLKMSPEESFHMTSVFGGIRFNRGVPQVTLNMGLEDAKKKILR